ncbi:DDE-domain-containing protein, partial [Lentinus tigrinus ALCF2SS1-6]
FNVSYDTLLRRYKGVTKPRNLAHESQQILTHAQERALVDWLVHLSQIGRPLNKRTVRQKVKRISARHRTPSRKWLSRFLARHKELKLGKPSGLDPKRAQAFNEATVEHHFELLRQVMEEHNIPWAHVYNMDEKGIQRGRRNGEQEKYILHRSERPMYKLRSANLELVMVIECVRADGESLKPAFIFPGKGFHKEWFDVDPDILVCMSPNGWTDDELCAEWFEHSFIPQANAQRISDAPILLIYDGHNSHSTPRLVELALEHGIHLFCLPPHTPHKLQPLDVGVFAQLSGAWKKRCDDIVRETDHEMPKADIVREYMSVREVSVTPELVRAAFRASGLNPLNP